MALVDVPSSPTFSPYKRSYLPTTGTYPSRKTPHVDTFILADSVRSKLSSESSNRNGSLRRLVGHANLYDVVLIALHKREVTQTGRRSDSCQSDVENYSDEEEQDDDDEDEDDDEEYDYEEEEEDEEDDEDYEDDAEHALEACQQMDSDLKKVVGTGSVMKAAWESSIPKTMALAKVINPEIGSEKLGVLRDSDSVDEAMPPSKCRKLTKRDAAELNYDTHYKTSSLEVERDSGDHDPPSPRSSPPALCYDSETDDEDESDDSDEQSLGYDTFRDICADGVEVYELRVMKVVKKQKICV